MHGLPSGTVTFLFTDIEGSTPLWERDPEGMHHSLARHNAIMDEAIQVYAGKVFRTVGDAYCAAFAQPVQAIQAALSAQRALQVENWGSTGPLRVRMGIHTGPAEAQGSEYLSTHTLNRVQRVMSAGHGGQILVSRSAVEVARGHLPSDVIWVDLGEHLLKGLSLPERIFQAVVPDLPADFPPLQSSSAVKHNFPESLTPFVGRERELEKLERLMEGLDPRLVTLHGMGGSGKTRLAIETGRRALPGFQHGVWFVSLAPLDSAEQVPGGILRALELSEVAGSDEQAFLLRYLHPKKTLLILDNLEHLLPGCLSLLMEILQGAPGVKLLVTSRDRLNLPGEWVFELGGLDYPQDESADELEGYGAVALFQQQLQRVWGVTWAEAEKPCVRKICVLVQGIPLALELAAGWGRVLSCSEIAAEMQKSIDFLESRSLGLPERQRSLKAVFDYSWRMLREDVQSVLIKLSIFRGGFEREAAEKVAGANLVSLAALVDHALVERRPDGRYQLHELLRQYASGLLSEGEREALALTHLVYFTELAERAEPLLRGAEQIQWFQKIDKEYINLQAALDFAEGKDHHTGLRLGSNLWWYWVARGIHKQELPRLELFLERTSEDLSLDRARALCRAAFLRRDEVDDYSFRLAQEGLHLCRSFGDRQGEAFAAMVSGLIFSVQHNYFEASNYLEESLKIFREVGDQWGCARALFNLGNLEMLQGKRTEAKPWIEESLAICREIGDVRGISQALENQASIVFDEGDPWMAGKLLEESLLLLQQMKARGFIYNSSIPLSEIQTIRGDYEKGWFLAEEMLSLGRDLNDDLKIGTAYSYMGWIAKLQKDFTKAKALLEASEEILCRINDDQSLPTALVWLGYVFGILGKHDLAGEKMEECLAIISERSLQGYHVYFYYYLAPSLARINRVIGEHHKAIEWYGKIFPPFKENGVYPYLPSILEDFALALNGWNKARKRRKWKESAVLLIGAAETMRSQMGVPRPPIEWEEFERGVESLKAALGNEKYDALRTRGLQMTREQAIDQANSICQEILQSGSIQ
jgi:predicted ATPase/class 3 adenylate cyclase